MATFTKMQKGHPVQKEKTVFKKSKKCHRIRNRASVCTNFIFDPSLFPSLFQLFLIKCVIHSSSVHFKPTDKIVWLSNLKHKMCDFTNAWTFSPLQAFINLSIKNMWMLCVLIKVFVPIGASAQLQDFPRKETLVLLLRGLTIHGCPSVSAQPLPEDRNRAARSWHTTLQLIKPSKNNPTWLRGVSISVFTCVSWWTQCGPAEALNVVLFTQDSMPLCWRVTSIKPGHSRFHSLHCFYLLWTLTAPGMKSPHYTKHEGSSGWTLFIVKKMMLQPVWKHSVLLHISESWTV